MRPARVGIAGILTVLIGAAAVPEAASQEIRVGLADPAPAARISASAPFVVRAGALEVEAVEALVSPVTRPGPSVLALGSFTDARAAREVTQEFADAGLEPGPPRVERDPETGRHLAVLPVSGATRTELAGRAGRLREAGFPGAGVFDLPVPSGTGLVVRPLGGLAVHLPEVESVQVLPPTAGGFLEFEGRPYRGDLEIRRAPAGVIVVNRVELEDYLLGVLPQELPPDLFPELEALKAQALAARTYALRPREAWLARGYDLCAGPGCQVYGGASAEHPLSTAAVRKTAGETITYQGQLIDALYTAACGGSTENAENVFSTPTPYLVARTCIRGSGGTRIRSGAPADEPLDAAVARTAAPLPDGWRGTALDDPAGRAGAGALLGAVLAHLGLPVCDIPRGGSNLTVGDLALLVEAVRCRDGWRPGNASDRSEGDAGSAVARLLAEGLFDPGAAGVGPERPARRREVVGVAAALLRRQWGLFRRGLVREAGSRGVVVETGVGQEGTGGWRRDGGERLLLEVGAGARLFREITPVRIPGREDPDPVAFPEAELRLRPGDFIRYHEVPSPDPAVLRVDTLILEDLGEAHDRFSRLRSWLVPKNNQDLSDAVARVRPVGEITALEPLETGPSGRVVRLRIVGTRGQLDLRGLAIRRTLGLSENLFFAEPRRAPGGGVTEWWFSGRGWGHGLGLCQAGAYGMAAAGATYREILAHYYPGTAVSPASR